MSGHVYKVIELVGSSRATIEDAVKNALSRASDSLRRSRWFEVTQIRGQVEGEDIAYWQVGVKLGFDVEEKPDTSSAKDTAKAKPGQPAKVSGKYRCKVCGYIYDPQKGDPNNGIKPGTAFEALPADWTCPECGVNKDQFEAA